MITETYSWEQVLGNPYSVSPIPAMLEEGGTIIPRRVGIKGGQKYSKDFDIVLVTYDSTYVISYLANRFLKKLVTPDTKYNALQTILSKAYKQVQLEIQEGNK
ncbi:MAG: hypothetical protein AAFW84_09750 [Cyanobacteria bacterium J06635_15]